MVNSGDMERKLKRILSEYLIPNTDILSLRPSIHGKDSPFFVGFRNITVSLGNGYVAKLGKEKGKIWFCDIKDYDHEQVALNMNLFGMMNIPLTMHRYTRINRGNDEIYFCDTDGTVISFEPDLEYGGFKIEPFNKEHTENSKINEEYNWYLDKVQSFFNTFHEYVQDLDAETFLEKILYTKTHENPTMWELAPRKSIDVELASPQVYGLTEFYTRSRRKQGYDDFTPKDKRRIAYG